MSPTLRFRFIATHTREIFPLGPAVTYGEICEPGAKFQMSRNRTHTVLSLLCVRHDMGYSQKGAESMSIALDLLVSQPLPITTSRTLAPVMTDLTQRLPSETLAEILAHASVPDLLRFKRVRRRSRLYVDGSTERT